jgi:hypothetical protein
MRSHANGACTPSMRAQQGAHLDAPRAKCDVLQVLGRSEEFDGSDNLRVWQRTEVARTSEPPAQSDSDGRRLAAEPEGAVPSAVPPSVARDRPASCGQLHLEHLPMQH